MKEAMDRLRKEDLIGFLSPHDNREKMGKKTLINALLEEIESGVADYRAVFSHELLLMSPVEVEDYLKITRTQRKKWQKDGRLPVHSYIEISKYGGQVEVPRFEFLYIHEVTQDTLTQWIQKDKRVADENRKKGREKARVTAEENKIKRKNAKAAYDDKLLRLSMVDFGDSLIYALSYWTVWISRWAKVYHKKSITGLNKNRDRYERRKKELYLLKDHAIQLLVKTKNVRIKFYEPEEHFKETFWLCDFHVDRMREVRQFSYGHYNAWTYFLENKSEIADCDDCIYIYEEHFYSLYFLEILSDYFDERFSFHVPHSIGCEYLPDESSLERVEHDEGEGMFRFGRPLTKEESVLYKEKEVVENLKKAIENMKILIDEISIVESTS